MYMLAAVAVMLLGVMTIGCGNNAPGHLICAFCNDDSQCGGNPCFQDVSGQRFCGAPCDSCLPGFSCQPLAGTNGVVVKTCFPDNETCLGTPGPNQSGGDSADMAVDPGPPPDFAGSANPVGGIPVGGPVGPTGGTVDRLFFGFTGDTRPDNCGTAYPTMVINDIFTKMKANDVQFAVDQGDHIFNCGSDFSGARDQMNLYVNAAALLGKTVFMTMGNHECTYSASQLCSANPYGTNPNYTAFMDALKTVSAKPYYRFDVKTNTGLAVFLVVADDAWSTEQQTWLTAQLTDADANAKYTFVSKHHPDRNTDHPEFQQIYDLVRAHKYTLFLTGHSHLYKRQSTDPRAIVMGIGGAPLAGTTYHGYGTALQGTDDRIYVNVYDSTTGNVRDKFDVAPQ
jgi:calcineurin-like phosphoesterase family protein